MADNVAITAGSGTTIATDDIGSGVQAQRIKLLSGEDGSAEPYGDDDKGSNRSLHVAPRALQKLVVVTPTISTSIYASGDCIGGLQTITNAARENGGTGTLLSIIMLDKTQAQRASIDLMFFKESVTSAGDNAPVAFSDADMANCTGIATIGPYNTVFPGTPLNSLSTAVGVNLPYATAAAGTGFYVQAVVRGTPTYGTTSDLQFTYGILLD